MILDTNALSAFADGDDELLRVIAEASELYVPVIVLGEYRFGIEQSQHRNTYETWLAEALTAMEVLPVLESTSIYYARICHALRARGRPIPTNDAWIAAMAVEHGMPVLSRDAHFDEVPQLRRISWPTGAY
ncbi:MAG: type II toxin-antitoxin system VapC family toxin [Planctomycetes bacterium]|nr:type II toxin-antitoxin system VapC family toxin [Planctomycetota bacterium]